LKKFDVDVAAEFIYTRVAAYPHQVEDAAAARPRRARRHRRRSARRSWSIRLLEHEKYKTRRRCCCKSSNRRRPLVESRAPEFKDAEGTEAELAADVIDLVKVFQQIRTAPSRAPSWQVDEDTVTVSQMIDYIRRRLISKSARCA